MRSGWKPAVAMTLSALALCACQTMKAKGPAPAVAPPVADSAPHLTPPAFPTPAPAVAPAKSCVPKAFPKAPKYPDTAAALRDAGGAADRYQLMAAGRLLRERRLADLEKVVDGCR